MAELKSMSKTARKLLRMHKRGWSQLQNIAGVNLSQKQKQKRQRGARCATWLGGSLGRQADS